MDDILTCPILFLVMGLAALPGLAAAQSLQIARNTIESRFTRARTAAVGLIFLFLCSSARGQANFVENFDNLGPVATGQLGPASLVSQGWIFRNQSQPVGGINYTWRDGPYMFMGQFMTFAPQAGAGYLGADARSTETSPFNFGGTICDWTILPPIQNQQVGDVVSLWARRGSAQTTNDIIEIRYSPSGGTSSGSGPQGIGDFTVLLRSINPVPSTGWGMFDATVPGPGRLAIRYLSAACIVGCFQPYVGIDSVSVGPPALPCPDFVQIPQAGQQVTWTAEGGPYEICADVLIPATSTVIVEPGVTVNINANRNLIVEGSLLAPGTSAGPITFSAPDQTARIKVFGTAEFDFASFNCRIEPQDGGGSIQLRDCTIHADQAGALTTVGLPTYLWENPPFIGLERCSVIGDGVPSWDFLAAPAHVALRDVTFESINPTVGGYVHLDDVVSNNSPAFGLSTGMSQGVYVNTVTVTGAAGPGLALSGNCLLGPDNSIQGNQYPLSATGLLPGSVVPQTGNVNNLLRTTLTNPGAILADVGLPYVYDTDSGCVVGWPNIEPGVTIKMAPDAAICNQGGYVLVRGLPGAPITFERLNPSQSWDSFLIGVSAGSRLENCVIDGAHFGLITTLGSAWLLDSVVRGNDVGANANTYGILLGRKTQFSSNAVGVQTTDTSTMWLESQTNPNSFDGNTIAAEPFEFLAEIDARFNWWGDPSGPQHPANPGGEGDAIGGPGTTHFLPFLAATPDFDNHPPVVRLKKNDFLPDSATHAQFETDSRFIVEWATQDDDSVVEQRILFSAAGDFDNDFTLVDTLPPAQRSYEWTVPDVPFIVNGALSYLRVVAVDSTGQEGWDQIQMLIPSGDVDDAILMTSDFGGQTFRSGQKLPPITWTQIAGGTLDGTPAFFIMLDGNEQSVYLGGGFVQEWDFTDSPYVSTDTARLAIQVQGTTNIVKWFFGDYFSLRPDPLIGDSPPSVTLLTPQSGDSFPGGGVVPITWAASDDEGLSSFNIQASYDGGRTWHVIARDLPGDSSGFNWPLPASAGIPSVRVRVIAKDLRFQNSAAGADVAFSIALGDPGQSADLNGDGVVNAADLALLLGSWGSCEKCSADLNNDGLVDAADLALLLGEWT